MGEKVDDMESETTDKLSRWPGDVIREAEAEAAGNQGLNKGRRGRRCGSKPLMAQGELGQRGY